MKAHCNYYNPTVLGGYSTSSTQRKAMGESKETGDWQGQDYRPVFTPSVNLNDNPEDILGKMVEKGRIFFKQTRPRHFQCRRGRGCRVANYY